MGLMRALQGVATGYLDARVSQFEAAAEAKRKEKELADKYKAEEAMRINIQNNERIENNKLLAAEKEAERERRKNDLLNLGFTDEFIAAHGQYALGSDQNFSNFIKLGQDQYGVARWWDTPINFGNTKGLNVQEHLMSGNTFDSESIKNETKNRANIPDAIADNQIQTGEKVSTNKITPSLNGKDLFFAKATTGRSEGKNYIHQQSGQVIHTFQYAQTAGKTDYGGQHYTMTYEKTEQDGKEILMPQISMVTDMSQFVELESTLGQNIYKNLNPLIDSITQTSYLIRNPNTGIPERITGQLTTYTTGQAPTEILHGISPSLAESLGIELSEVVHVPEDGTPFDDTTLETKYNTFLVDKDKFSTAVYDNTGFTLEPVGSTASGSLPGDVSAPKSLGNSAKNTLVTNAISLAGFQSGEGQDFMTENVTGEGTIARIFGDTEAQRAVSSFKSILDDSLSYLNNKQLLASQTGGIRGDLDESQGRFAFPPNVGAENIQNFQKNYAIFKDSSIASELNLDINSENVSPDNFANRVAEYYKNIRETLATNEVSYLESLDNENSKTRSDGEARTDFEQYLFNRKYKGTETEISNIASELTDIRLQNITTLDDLLQMGNQMKEQTVIGETTRDSKIETKKQGIVDKYFPPSEREMGATLESFVNNYITDPQNIEQAQDLDIALQNLTVANPLDYEILSDRVEEIIDNIDKTDSKSDFQTRLDKRETEKSKKSEEETGFATIEDWLNSEGNKVGLPSEINLNNLGYNTEDMEEYQIKRAQNELFRKENPDHNPETGLKLFINPDLSPGNVEPRPSKPIFKGLPDKRGGYEDWNRLWGATHNPDGTPKQKT
jgi:hypothetical protein